MATATKTIRVMETSSVAPPANAAVAAEQRLPLTYFDMPWLNFQPVKRILFYKLPCSTAHFLQTIIPNLKSSLSLTLQLYLPFSGNLLYPLNSGLPELRYVSGDSVTVTIAESSEAFDFNCLMGDHARDADDFHHFVPDMPEPVIDSGSGFKIIPLVAIQVTVFAESCFAIGLTNHHVIGDARSTFGFFKTWSSISKHGKLSENQVLPFYDRSVIKDPSGRTNLFWKQMQEFQFGPSSSSDPTLPTNRVRSTFTLRKSDIEKLKNHVSERASSSMHLSSFTVSISYVWACITKSAAEAGEEAGNDEPEYYGFAVDARRWLDPPVPAGYFGNCVVFMVVGSTHGEMKGEDGFVVLAELVGDLIRKKVNKEELMRDADEWLVKIGPLMGARMCGVAASPKFDIRGRFRVGKTRKV